MYSVSFADGCYFQSRRSGYDEGTYVQRVYCQTVQDALDNIQFYDEHGNNYARYYERQFGREGNLIIESGGTTTMVKFYYAMNEYRFYGRIVYRGSNVSECITTTSSRRCGATEYTEFGMYLRDFFASSARR